MIKTFLILFLIFHFFFFFYFFRCGLESNTLRFLAKLVTDSPIDKDRKFIICYFLSDDTISVFEHSQRNTGKM